MIEQALSLIGAGLVLLAFTLNTLGKVDRQSIAYPLLNMIGSIALLVSAVITVNLGFIVLNVVWIGVSGWGLLKEYNDDI